MVLALEQMLPADASGDPIGMGYVCKYRTACLYTNVMYII